jgi:TolB-like protein/DNA-binding winged helix-turn-helix (wHTH) protein/Tfp pilus assembly protein PilF
MMPGQHPRETFHFGEYVLDTDSYELRRNGRIVRLERQPMDLLILLVRRRGHLVPRMEIVDRLWGKDVFVDVETGVHTAIRKVRQALRDSPDRSKFVETIPGRGYRFIADVRVVSPDLPAAAEAVVPEVLPLAAVRRHRAVSVRGWATVGLLAVALLTGGLVWRSRVAWVGPVPATLAVLPFQNLSGDPEREYVAEGLAEETIASLGHIDPERLGVVAGTSTRAYRGTAKSASQIGSELKADYLVEGSLQAESGRLRVTVRLIRVADQLQIWSHSYDREPASMLGLQQELSAAIAEQVRLRLSPERLDTLARRQTQNEEAYDLYQRARNFEDRRTPASTARAIEFYERATALDPSYALAWVGISRTHAARILNSDADPVTGWPVAREAAAEALRIAPDLAEVQFAHGFVKWCCDWDWAGAEASMKRALEIDPRLAPAQLTLGHAFSQLGRHEEAAALALRARELEPLSPMSYAISSQIAFQRRDYRKALEFGQQAVALAPEFWIGHMMLGQAYGQSGDIDRALEALAAAASFSGQNSKALSLRGYLQAKAGRHQEARELLAALETASRTKYVPPSAMALVNAGLDDTDAMFGWLERAYAARDTHLIFLTVDPKWDAFRADPRFRDLLARCGFVPGSHGSR